MSRCCEGARSTARRPQRHRRWKFGVGDIGWRLIGHRSPGRRVRVLTRRMNRRPLGQAAACATAWSKCRWSRRLDAPADTVRRLHVCL